MGSATPWDLPPDRLNLFHAFFTGLSFLGFANQSSVDIRDRIANFIASNPNYCIEGKELNDLVRGYNANNLSADEYAMFLRQGNFLGGEIEMAIFCQIWPVNLGLYRPFPGGLVRIKEYRT